MGGRRYWRREEDSKWRRKEERFVHSIKRERERDTKSKMNKTEAIQTRHDM